jgi:hypothetical protein
MNLQEMANIVKRRGYANGSIDRIEIEVEPFVYEKNNIANTIVLEFDNLVLTLNNDATYTVENMTKLNLELTKKQINVLLRGLENLRAYADINSSDWKESSDLIHYIDNKAFGE